MKYLNLKSLLLKIVFLSLFFFHFVFCSGQNKKSNLNFSPGSQWYDTDGNPINAHAGGILQHEGIYYWYGQIMISGERGSDAWVGVSCYSSKDLYNWEYKGVAFAVEDHASHPVTRGCKIERPKVIYNTKTKKFVMWWHHDINGQGHKKAMTGIAVSDNATGPFTFVQVFRPLAGFLPMNEPEKNKNKTLDESLLKGNFPGHEIPYPADSMMLYKRDLHLGQMTRDMTLFVDDDKKAYHIYASEENSTLHIAELTDDYLGYTGKFIRVFQDRFMEAPTIFKHKGKYYIIASGCSGWAPNAARSATSSSIWGPWKELGNPCFGKDAEISYNSQGTYILSISGKADGFIFMADRWKPQNAVDSRYVWLPVQFKDNRIIIEWMDQWDLGFFK